MELISTPINDLYVLQPRVFGDDRGYFMETYNRGSHGLIDLDYDWVQDNEARSDRGVLRGLHLQTGASAQAKLVRVVTGAALDVAVDLRVGSSTYGQHYALELSGTNKLQMLVPRGFAHGYLALVDDTVFCYKCDNYYDKAAEAGLRYDDPSLGIDWPMAEEELLIAERDRGFGLLADTDTSAWWTSTPR